MTTVVFETPRFRVHITDRVAWIEKQETAGWVLTAQVSMPVPLDTLAESGPGSALKAAVLDFEESRGGDQSLRAALTGNRPTVTAKVAIAPKAPIRRPSPPPRTSRYW